jgi:hypothetical protein
MEAGSRRDNESSAQAVNAHQESLRLAVTSNQYSEPSSAGKATVGSETHSGNGVNASSADRCQLLKIELADSEASSSSTETSFEGSRPGIGQLMRRDSNASTLSESTESGAMRYRPPYLLDGNILRTDEALDRCEPDKRDVITITYQQAGWSAESVSCEEEDNSQKHRQNLRGLHSAAVLKIEPAKIAAQAQAELDDGMDTEVSFIDTEMQSDLDLARQLGALDV